MTQIKDVDINATTRNKNVVTETSIERRPKQPNQPQSPADRENRNTREPDPDAPARHPNVMSPVK